MISIIVPIYNTSAYLKRCLESLISQSFNDIEIILINDGSTDSSETLCLEYKNKYKKVKYFYKENGGLSSARNYGVKNALGDLVTFVDSDDWVDRDYCKCLYAFYLKTKSKVLVSDLYLVDGNGKVSIQNPHYPESASTYSTEDILKWLFSGFKIGSACGVLFEKSVFNDTSFKEGILDEDFEFSFRLYCKISKLVLVPYRGYYYDARPGSITKSLFNEEKQVFVENPYKAFTFLKNNSIDKELIKLAKQFYILRLHKTIRLICWSGYKRFRSLFYHNKKLMIATSFNVCGFKSIKPSSKFLLFFESFFPLTTSRILKNRIQKKKTIGF